MNIEFIILIVIITLILLWVFRKQLIHALGDILEVFVDLLATIFKGLD